MLDQNVATQHSYCSRLITCAVYNDISTLSRHPGVRCAAQWSWSQNTQLETLRKATNQTLHYSEVAVVLENFLEVPSTEASLILIV